MKELLSTLLLLSLLMAALVLFEVWPRVTHYLTKVRLRRQSGTEALSVQLVFRMRRECEGYLRRRDNYVTGPDGSFRTERLIRSLTGERGGRPRNNWSNALLTNSLCVCHEELRDEDALNAAREHCRALLTQEGGLISEPKSVSDCMVGVALLYLCEQGGREEYLRGARKMAEFLLREAPRSSTGTLLYLPHRTNGLYVDALPCVSPFMARYGVATARDEFVDLAVHQLREFMTYGVDTRSGLPFHGYSDGGGGALGTVGWARGTGWLLMALVDTLSALPREGERFNELEAWYLALCERCRHYQSPEGGWRFLLPYGDAPLESSGTALIAYGIERGVRRGLLRPSWGEVSERAIESLLERAMTGARVVEAEPECRGIGFHSPCYGAAPWAQGPATAAAAQIVARRSHEGEAHEGAPGLADEDGTGGEGLYVGAEEGTRRGGPAGR